MSPKTKLQSKKGEPSENPEREVLKRLTSLLEKHHAFKLVSESDVDEMMLPSVVVDLLRAATADLAAGKSVAVSAVQSQLTTQEAANLLGVSRPYLVRLLDDGKLPSSKVGTHRRVIFEDVIAYKRVRDEQRLATLNRMTAEAEDLGLPY